MKFIITMKDLDGVFYSTTDAIISELEKNGLSDGLTDDERDNLIEERRYELKEVISIFFRYLESVDIEIDTELKTARVVPVNERT